MNAIILAAGEGKRLRPLTNDKPKCMIDLFGKSILQRQIEIFQGCGINDISVVTGYCDDKIVFDNIRYVRNKKYATTNMVETLFCAKEILGDSTIVSYGDIIFEKNVLEKLIDATDDICVVVDKDWYKYWKIRFDNPLEDTESLVIDDNGYIKEIGQKVTNVKQIMGQYIGLIKFQHEGIILLKNFYENVKKQAFKGINPLNPKLPFEKSYLTDLLQALILSDYKIKSIPINNGWLEVDTKHDYEVYNRLYEENKLHEFILLDK